MKNAPSKDFQEVKELWWEGENLCIRTKDNKVWKYTNAQLVKVDYEKDEQCNIRDEDGNVVMHVVEIKFE